MTLYLTPGGRLHDASIGRFLSRDPVAPAGANPYVYAKDNPARFVDPTGLREFPGSGWQGLLSDPCDPDAPAIWIAPDGTRFEGTTNSIGKRIPSKKPEDDGLVISDNEDVIFVEEFPCPVSEGPHSIDWLYRIAKSSGTSGGSALDLLEMAKRIGLAKGVIKTTGAKRYVNIKGLAGLRKYLTGTHYLARNPKVYDFVACRKIGTAVSRQAVSFAIVSTLSISVIEAVLDKQTLGQLGVSVAVDVAVQMIGIGSGALTTVAVSTAGGSVVPVVGNAIGLVVGIGVVVLGDWLVSRYRIKRLIYEAVLAVGARVLRMPTREGWTTGEILAGEPLKALMRSRMGDAVRF